MKDGTNNSSAAWQLAAADSKRFCNELAKSVPAWLQHNGPHSNIVLSTRIRLARNLANHPFPSVADNKDLNNVNNEVWAVLSELQLLPEPHFIDMAKLLRLDREVLVERRLASPQFIERKGPSMLALTSDESLSIMINEEDHLRLQAIQPGLAIAAAWEAISKLDDRLSENLEYAFSERFGYLTACPTNTGTGIRVSILMHLPAVVMLNEVEEVMKSLASRGMTMRGLYGEGTEANGNMFQISNQLTLGKTEAEVMSEVEKMVEEIKGFEHLCRSRIILDKGNFMLDQIWRAYGMLRYARVLNSKEFLNLLSMMRLARDCNEKEMKQWPLALLNELMVMMQPAHLRKAFKSVRLAHERDTLRAELVRFKLSLQS